MTFHTPLGTLRLDAPALFRVVVYLVSSGFSFKPTSSSSSCSLTQFSQEWVCRKVVVKYSINHNNFWIFLAFLKTALLLWSDWSDIYDITIVVIWLVRYLWHQQSNRKFRFLFSDQKVNIKLKFLEEYVDAIPWMLK